MAQLQRPEIAYMNGRLVQWDQAVLHVGSEAVVRGLNVFEGVKAYWQPDRSLKIAMARQHYLRLCRSARLLHMPCAVTTKSMSRDRSANRCVGQARSRYVGSHDSVCDRWALGREHIDRSRGDGVPPRKSPSIPIRMGVSTWRRSADVSLPPRVKTGSNYEVSRFARIEGRAHGCDDMVLLNPSGRVAEATASYSDGSRRHGLYTASLGGSAGKHYG